MVASVGLAILLWFVSFTVPWGNFWLKISASAAILAGLTVMCRPATVRPRRPTWRDLGLGVLSALLLYLLFWVSQRVVTLLVPSAAEQVARIYTQGQPTPGWVMACLSLFVTGPGEEIFWRGYVQGQLMERLGAGAGWLAATLLYTFVHVWSFNPMLVAGAALAGAFWGGLYLRFRGLWPVVLCHSLWSAAVFWFLPLA